MFAPDLFDKYGADTQRETEIMLKDFIHLIKWNKDGQDDVMDVGCGPGNATTRILLPLLPKNFRKLVGVDYSDRMIEYATLTYSQPKVAFHNFSVTSKTIPEEFVGEYDHIFSLLCLHMIQDHRQTFKNFNKILRPGGDMLLTFFKTYYLYGINEDLSKTEKWAPYMQNFKNLISPYHFSDNPAEEIENLLRQEGFTDINIHLKKSVFVLDDLQLFKNVIMEANKYYTQVPDELFGEYTEITMKIIKDMGFIHYKNDGKLDKIKVPYEIFIVVARKVK